MKLDEIKREGAKAKIPLPNFWGGYMIKQDDFDFWQGCADRLHERFLYTKTAEPIPNAMSLATVGK